LDQINFLTLIPYVFITTFTPGPNNISCAASSARWGLRRTWGYLLGIGLGFFVLLLLSGVFSGALIAVLPGLESYMRWVGATYILWLAYGIAKNEGQGGLKDDAPRRGFAKGFMLQFANPKAILFAVTLYTTFLGPILAHLVPVVLSAALIAIIGFTSIMSWAVFGLGIHRFLQNPLHRRIVNRGFALLLVWTAANVARLL
jgi:cysteine/O-acetylserine efflux protein